MDSFNLYQAIGGTVTCRKLSEAFYARVKRDEWRRYHEQVTPWEIAEYLTRF